MPGHTYLRLPDYWESKCTFIIKLPLTEGRKGLNLFLMCRRISVCDCWVSGHILQSSLPTLVPIFFYCLVLCFWTLKFLEKTGDFEHLVLNFVWVLRWLTSNLKEGHYFAEVEVYIFGLRPHIFPSSLTALETAVILNRAETSHYLGTLNILLHFSYNGN